MGKFKYGYIIPIHEKSELVFRALESAMQFKNTLICISCNEDIQNWIDENKGDLSFELVEYVINEDTSYQSLVNDAIQALTLRVDLISILEFDDVVTPSAHDIIDEYSIEYPEKEVYMPLACLVTEGDNKDDKLQMIAMLNEAPFAPGMTDEYGILDFNLILKANFAFINGCYFKAEVFEDSGMFKKNLKLLYDYEFIIRLIYNGVEIMSIPKVCRFHYFREDGEFERQKKLPVEDREFWLTIARKEYMFSEDREIKR